MLHTQFVTVHVERVLYVARVNPGPMSKLKVGVDVGENDAEPRQFLECALLAEEEGFDSFWFGDHFMPWIHTGGKSVFVWSLLASSLERTNRIRMGPNVTCPIGGRYHPAIVAQAAATLDNMYPGRVMLGVGSGEAVNEARFIRGQESDWPDWRERIERLTEAVTLIRELWSREGYFTFNGKYFPMKDVTLLHETKDENTDLHCRDGTEGSCISRKIRRQPDHDQIPASLSRSRLPEVQ